MLCAVSHLHGGPSQAPASPRSCASGSYSRNLPANEGARLSHLHCSEASELAALTDPFRLQPSAQQGLTSEQTGRQKLELSVLI